MERSLLIVALSVLSVSGYLNAFDRVSQYTNQASNPSVSQFYSDKLASKGQAGQMANTQLQTVEGMGQQRLQNTSAMQRFQNVNQSVQQPTSGISSRFGGGKFF